jgi:hypothetical protein
MNVNRLMRKPEQARSALAWHPGDALRRLFATACVVAGLAVPQPAFAQASGNPLPQHLGDTGLFAPGSTTQIARGVIAFSPQYPLWSDGAAKRRWIALPPGASIDAANPDAWAFPLGTRLWKEFSLGSRRVETRFIERLQDGSWRYATYVWNEDGTDAVLAPADGIASITPAGGRRYAIPSEADCRACHEGPAVPVLGFSALQLSPDRDPLAPHAEPSNGVDLRALSARGSLRNVPPEMLKQPPRIAAASPIERAALGYLHGNCGHCHGKPDESGASVPVGIVLAQSAAQPDSASTVVRSLVGAGSRFRPAGTTHTAHVVAPGASHASVLTLRMRSRVPSVQMPPLGSEVPDSEALALIERWIDSSLQHRE